MSLDFLYKGKIRYGDRSAVIPDLYKKLLDEIPETISEGSLAKKTFTDFCDAVLVARNKESLVKGIPVVKVIDTILVYAWENRRHLNLVACPSMYKSTRARAMICYALGINPMTRAIVVSGDIKIAKMIVSSCRQLMDSSRYKRVFPEVLLDSIRNRKIGVNGDTAGTKIMGNTLERFYLVNSGADPSPALEAVSWNPNVEARRVDLGLFDDVSSRRSAESKHTREAINKAFQMTWIDGRLKGSPHDGTAVTINNIWHSKDLPSMLRKDTRFDSIFIGITKDLEHVFVRAENTKPDHPLYELMRIEGFEMDGDRWILPKPPESRWSMETLLNQMMNNPNAATMLHLEPPVETNTMFPSWANRRCEPMTVADIIGHGSYEDEMQRLVVSPEARNHWRFAVGMDFSGTSRPGDTVFFVAINRTGHWLPVEIHYGNYNADNRIEIIENAYRRGIVPCTIRPENAGIQTQMINELRIAGGAYPWARLIEDHKTNTNKTSSDNGLPVIDLEISQGRFLWPDLMTGTNRRDGAFWRRLDDEMEECPKISTIAKPTPDGPMTIWFAREGLRQRGGFSTYMGGVVSSDPMEIYK